MSLCAGKPEAYFVVPDPYTPEVYSASSQAGAHPGVAISTTPGQLIPMQSGDSIASGVADQYNYALVRSGGPGTAEFVYKPSSEPNYLGKDDLRHWWGFHSPITNSTPGADDCSTMFHAQSGNLYVFGASGTNGYFYRRNVDTSRYDSWTLAYTLTMRQSMSAGDHGAALIDMPGGAALLIVRVTGGADFDVYYATDPTTNTWQLISRDILLRFNGATLSQDTSSQIRVARSGDYIRLVFAATNAFDAISGRYRAAFYTMLSQDRGSTWKMVSSGGYLGSNRGVAPTPYTTDDRTPFDLCAVDDAGTFALGVVALGVGSSSQSFSILTASGQSDWNAELLPYKTMSQPIHHILMGFDGYYVYALVFSSDLSTSVSDGWRIGRAVGLEIAGLTTTWEWSAANAINTIDGTEWIPCRNKLVFCGDGGFVYGGLRTESTGTSQTTGSAWYFGSWTERSLGDFGPSQNLGAMSTALWNLMWPISSGRPTDGAGTAWTLTTSGTTAETLTPNALQIDGSALGSNRYYSHGETTAGTWYTSGGVFRWVVRLNTGDGSATVPCIGLRIVMADAAGANQRSCDIRIGPASASVYDNNASAFVASLTGLFVDTGSLGAFTEFRLVIGAGGTSCRLSGIDTTSGNWYDSATFSLASAAVVGISSIRFGLINQNVAGTQTSWWREVMMTMDGTYLNQQAANAFPATTINSSTNLLFGEITTPLPKYLEYGLYVSWTGLSGMERDDWTGYTAYSFAKESVLVDSPRIAWRTVNTAATATVILYIGASEGRFTHNAVALFGCNNRNVLIDYDDTPAFSAPVDAQTVDMTAYGTGVTPLVVSLTTGTSLLISGSSFKFTAGELVNCYVRMTTGAAAGNTYKITRHPVINRVQFDDQTTDLNSQGVLSNDQFIIFSPNGVKKYSSNSVFGSYMRIRLADTNTAEGYHQLGTIVPGISIDVDVPLDWAHTDDDQPNVTSFRTKSGIAWAFAEGPTQRTYTGRVVGDAERWREKFRNMFRQISYEGKACAFVLNADQTPESLMLGRVKSGGSLDNAGWYRDSNGIMRTTGDLSLTFVEEK